MSNSILRIGIFGVGHLGKLHIENWKNIENIKLVGFYDPDDSIAKEVSVKYTLTRFNTPEALLEACHAVDIVTPTPSHYELCAMAIRKSKHVFVEKPMANTIQEAYSLVKLVKESKVIFQVGHVERFNPAFTALQHYNLKPMFIEVHRLAQFNPRGTEVSVVLDLMIHDIDIILSIIQSGVKAISASGIAVMTDTPDIANVRIEFNNGCVANLTSSRMSMKKMRKMRLFQKDMYVSIDFLNKKTEVIKIKDSIDEQAFTFDVSTPKGKKAIAVINPIIKNESALHKELSCFVNAVQQQKRSTVNEIDGLLAMEVAHQILEKIAQAATLA